MSSDVLSDASTSLGARVRERLETEEVIWFTTVGADGTPQPNPVWFVWESGGILVYTRTDAHRLNHIRERPQVSLHFNSDGHGGDVAVLRGTAQVVNDYPPPHEVPAYVAKYGDEMVRILGSLEKFSAEYGVPVRVEFTGVRGF